MHPTEHPDFTTITCLQWQHILKADREKDIIIDSLRFLVVSQRIIVFAFVIMDNHFHLIWQIRGLFKRENVQRDFLKFTSQQILKNLRTERSSMLPELCVLAEDRKYQIWERNSLHVPLWTPKVFDQKMEYIHMNPVKAGLCSFAEDYKYSSAAFYLLNETMWNFITHADE